MPTQRSVAVQFWASPAIRPTSCGTKLFALFCLIGPQSNFGGLFTLSRDDAADLTRLTWKQITAALEELGQVQADGEPFLSYDPATRLIWIPKRIAYEFPGGKMGWKQIDGMKRILDACPPCHLLLRACERYQWMGNPFVTFAEGLRKRLGEGLPKGLAEPLPKGPESGSLLSSSGSRLSKESEDKSRPAGGASGDSLGLGNGKGGKNLLAEEQAVRLNLIARDLEEQAQAMKDRFNPWAAFQKLAHKLPVETAIMILRRCRDAHREEPIRSRWAWLQRVMDREHAAHCIRLQEVEHQALKSEKPNLEVMGSILRRIGLHPSVDAATGDEKAFE